MIRTADFKYTRYIEFGEELYDLRNDPDELANLADNPAYSAVKKDLADKLDRWIEENNDPFYSFHPTNQAGEPLT